MLFVVLFALIGASAAASCNSSDSVVVDLGYAVHKASSPDHNAFFNFSNIRYAEPPVGQLRFQAPVRPSGRNETIDDGSIGRKCPQAMAAWQAMAPDVLQQYLSGQQPSLTPEQQQQFEEPFDLQIPADPRETEDCLFLDVVTPKSAYHKAIGEDGPTELAPVMVWLYGGGCVSGDKTDWSPEGLLSAGVDIPSGVVFVAPNYRLGAFGWLAGPRIDASGGTANAGLYDQRLALEWVQEKIHLFGGDPNKVTVMGESAGGAGILHQLTAFGGANGPVPFQRAIPQSAAWNVVANVPTQEEVVDKFLSLANATSIEEAKQLPYSVLQKANQLALSNAPYGTVPYTPVVDGVFVPELPGQLLAKGLFDHDVEVLVGYNSNEGILLASPSVVDDATYHEFLFFTFPNITPDVANHIATALYPPILDGTFGYTTHYERAAKTLSEYEFDCNADYLLRAYSDRQSARGYMFSVPPGLHAQDVPFTFANGPDAINNVNLTVSSAMQQLFVSFADTGVPKSVNPPTLVPEFGSDELVLDIGGDGFEAVNNRATNWRCKWWQEGLYA